jgi:hypothetical protein
MLRLNGIAVCHQLWHTMTDARDFTQFPAILEGVAPATPGFS